MTPASDITAESGPRVLEIPEGDNRERLVCPDCGFINYENPKIVVGSVVGYDKKILLCRRDINPRRGFWTIPAGYLELNETVVDGARREAREEVRYVEQHPSHKQAWPCQQRGILLRLYPMTAHTKLGAHAPTGSQASVN